MQNREESKNNDGASWSSEEDLSRPTKKKIVFFCSLKAFNFCLLLKFGIFSVKFYNRLCQSKAPKGQTEDAAVTDALADVRPQRVFYMTHGTHLLLQMLYGMPSSSSKRGKHLPRIEPPTVDGIAEERKQQRAKRKKHRASRRGGTKALFHDQDAGNKEQ